MGRRDLHASQLWRCLFLLRCPHRKGALPLIHAAPAPRQTIPHGMIFATFMLSCMIGSSLASRLLVSPHSPRPPPPLHPAGGRPP